MPYLRKITTDEYLAYEENRRYDFMKKWMDRLLTKIEYKRMSHGIRYCIWWTKKKK